MCPDTVKKTVDVSVIIPAYNAGDYIERAIKSVLAQTCRPKEIIVINDGSTDNTAAIVKRYSPDVSYIYQNNSGCGAARNTGIKKSTCQWIAFLDADDQWKPQALQLELELLDENKDVVWAYANYINCFCADNKQSPAHDGGKINRLLQSNYYFNFFDAFMAGCVVWTGTIIIKRFVFDEVGMFRPAYVYGGDMDMWFRIAFRWPSIGYIAQPLAVYHQDIPGSITTKRRNLAILFDQFDNLFSQAQQHGRDTDFAPCAVKFVKYYIDVMLQQGYRSDVLKFITHFAHLLSFRYKTEMRLRAMFPKTAPVLLKKYIKLKRFLLSGGSPR